MRASLIRTLACLAVLAVALPLAGRAEEGRALTVTVEPGSVRATGLAPPGFPLRELRRRVPEIEISASESGSGEGAAADERLLDVLTIVLPRLAQGEVRLSATLVEIEGTLRPGFSAEATRGAARLALGSGHETRIDLAEAPPDAALAVTWSRHGAVVSGILPDGLSPPEALRRLREPVEGIVEGGLVDAGVTGGGAGDPDAWAAALPKIGRLLPAFGHAVARIGAGSLSVDGTLEPGHEANRLESWLAAELGEAWRVSVTGEGPSAREGATRRDPVSGLRQRLVGGRWIPLHAFAPDPAACGRRSGVVLAAEPLTFVSGRTELEEGAAATLDRLAGVARRCLNDGGLALEIGGHTDSRGDEAENRALSEARAMKVLLELVARGVRADAMRAVGHGESRALAGNDTETGRARNRRITFAWSE